MKDGSNESESDANRLKMEIAGFVARYEHQPDPIEHERLRPLIAQYYGADSAEFFDKEGCLPLSGSGGVGNFPWPMRPSKATNYALGVACLAIVIALIALGAMWKISPLYAGVVTVAVGAAVWLGVPAVHRLFPPKDLAERKRLVNVFADIVERNKNITAAQAESAREERMRLRGEKHGGPQAS